MIIGETFYSELLAAGLVGLPFSWSDDGNFYFGESMTDEQIASVKAVLSAHDSRKKHRDIKQEIAQLEDDKLLPRVLRELLLLLLTDQFTPEQLARNPSYVKLNQFEDEVRALRAML